MSRIIAACAALAALAACSVSPDGACTNDSQCTSPATCVNSLCKLPCEPKCGVGQVCLSAKCVQQGPIVSNVVVPAAWAPRASGTKVTITALVDDGPGPGTASATLHVAGHPDVPGTTSQTGAARTYSFDVPTLYQTPGSETPVA